MKKISLKNLNLKEVEQLSREQLKSVLGVLLREPEELIIKRITLLDAGARVYLQKLFDMNVQEVNVSPLREMECGVEGPRHIHANDSP